MLLIQRFSAKSMLNPNKTKNLSVFKVNLIQKQYMSYS